jgi:hypothetical protein
MDATEATSIAYGGIDPPGAVNAYSVGRPTIQQATA